MAIREKSTTIEFTFEHDTSESEMGPSQHFCYGITYDARSLSGKVIGINDSTSSVNNCIFCPVELLTEIVQFLISKNIIDSKNVPGLTPEVFSFPAKKESILNAKNIKTVLPLPVIQKKDQEGIMPLTSFDVETVPQSLPNAQTLSNDSDDSPISVEKGPEQKTVTASKITPEDEKLMKSRMVIKSRVSDPEEDPLGAEKEGAMLRESIGGKKARKIRKLD
jgi:hypothetical protein